MKAWHPWQLKELKFLELPAKLHSQFSPFVPFLRLFIWAEFPWDLGPPFFGHNISFLGSVLMQGPLITEAHVFNQIHSHVLARFGIKTCNSMPMIKTSLVKSYANEIIAFLWWKCISTSRLHCQPFFMKDSGKTFTENWNSKRHLLELSWPI